MANTFASKSIKMKNIALFLVSGLTLLGCQSNKIEDQAVNQNPPKSNFFKPLQSDLPTIGLLMYEGVLQGEVVATSDVFAKRSIEGKQLFNVVTIAETMSPITTEEGMRLLPDYTFETCPNLTALFVPSAYDMHQQVNNSKLIAFIQQKHEETTYMVSNCAGAQLIGKSGIAKGHKIVTWIGGGVQLQKDYPDLIVQNDSVVVYVEDGKFSSSNGNLASYIAALNLLEKMTGPAHRQFVEDYIYLDQLQNWKGL